MSTEHHLNGNGNAGERLNNDHDNNKMQQKYNISLLLIDHYDSFTYNLYDMLAQLTVEPPLVVTKDAYEGWNSDKWESIDGIILSPGPGSPQEQPDFSKEAIRYNPDTPILGVCLGHQLLALEYGANVDKAPVPIHGQDDWIRTFATSAGDNATTTAENDATVDPNEILSDTEKSFRYPSIFETLPPSFRAVRYHSLAAYDVPESTLKVTATSTDDVIQGLQHVENPHFGVQFHPESIGTQHGMDLLEKFCTVVQDTKLKAQEKEETIQQAQSGSSPLADPVNGSHDSTSDTVNADSTSKFRVYLHAVQGSNIDSNVLEDSDKKQNDEATRTMEPVDAFETFYGNHAQSIWLDSSSAASSGRGTLDIMAAPLSPEDVLEHYVDGPNTKDILTKLEERLFGDARSSNVKQNNDQRLYVVDDNFESIRNEKDDLQLTSAPNGNKSWHHPPFEYRGGYLGFLGYEVRHETQRFLRHKDEALENGQNQESKEETQSSVPDSVFFLARQSMVYHHPTRSWYLIALVEEDEEIENALQWMRKTADVLKRNEQDKEVPASRVTESIQSQQELLTFVPNRSKDKYKQDIADCHEFIRMGESYELCLTNQLEAEVPEPLSTWNLYRILRLRNPAPYSAYFRWNIDETVDADSQASFAICSSSPERFMSVKRIKRHPLGSISLQAEAKPIKGTCARVEPQNGICLSDAERREDERRAQSLELSLKNRAENLMIVDLLRNDMSRVCQIGSVHVAKLMAIESFATVHQMVSTIRGTLAESTNSLKLLRASFPGGSMTGAPKLRTLELLEGLEENVNRGPYAGSLGYLSVNGCMDMNIIIRSAVVTPSENGGQKIAIGAGGAITVLSEMEDEYEEMLLKARAVKEAVQTWANTSNGHASRTTEMKEEAGVQS